MRKFSIVGHYFITPGRYSCPGVSPARGGWPWNAGNAPVSGGPGRAGSLKVGSGSGGFRDGSGNGFGNWWLQGWFQGRFREWVQDGFGRGGCFREQVPWALVQKCFRGGCGSGRRRVCDFGSGSGCDFEDVSGVVPEWFRGGCGGGFRGWFRGRVRAWRPAVARGCTGGMVWGCRERPGEGSIRIFRAGGVP